MTHIKTKQKAKWAAVEKVDKNIPHMDYEKYIQFENFTIKNKENFHIKNSDLFHSFA